MGREMTAEEYDRAYDAWEWIDKPALATPWTPLWLAILAHIKPGDHVLDLGCGAGQLAEMRMARDGAESGHWLGLDFSERAVGAARSRLRGRGVFLVRDIREVKPIFFAGADVVVLSEALEHIEDDLGVLRQVPKGKRIVLSVPNFDSEGHVRHFETIESVAMRYADLFDNIVGPTLVKSVESATEGCRWYVMSGVRA